MWPRVLLLVGFPVGPRAESSLFFALTVKCTSRVAEFVLKFLVIPSHLVWMEKNCVSQTSMWLIG